MIKCIDNDIIRIGPTSELSDCVGVGRGFCGRFKLPLFSTKPIVVTKDDVVENTLCFVIREYIYRIVFDRTLPLKTVEKINKTWNEFYEESTR